MCFGEGAFVQSGFVGVGSIFELGVSFDNETAQLDRTKGAFVQSGFVCFGSISVLI